jgi:hypothetical protein
MTRGELWLLGAAVGLGVVAWIYWKNTAPAYKTGGVTS